MVLHAVKFLDPSEAEGCGSDSRSVLKQKKKKKPSRGNSGIAVSLVRAFASIFRVDVTSVDQYIPVLIIRNRDVFFFFFFALASR